MNIAARMLMGTIIEIWILASKMYTFLIRFVRRSKALKVNIGSRLSKDRIFTDAVAEDGYSVQ